MNSTGVNFGYEKTLHRLKRVVHWKGMKSSVREFIRHYEVCQRYKYENTHPTGLLQPCPFLTKFGKKFQWTSLKNGLGVEVRLLSWWWWIG